MFSHCGRFTHLLSCSRNVTVHNTSVIQQGKATLTYVYQSYIHVTWSIMGNPDIQTFVHIRSVCALLLLVPHYSHCFSVSCGTHSRVQCCDLLWSLSHFIFSCLQLTADENAGKSLHDQGCTKITLSSIKQLALFATFECLKLLGSPERIRVMVKIFVLTHSWPVRVGKRGISPPMA